MNNDKFFIRLDELDGLEARWGEGFTDVFKDLRELGSVMAEYPNVWHDERVRVLMPATIELIVDLDTGKIVHGSTLTPNVASLKDLGPDVSVLHDNMGEVDDDDRELALNICDGTDWPQPEWQS